MTQRMAQAQFAQIVGGLRLRVAADAEGWPMARGRYGNLEWHAAGVVAIYSQTPRMLAKLLAIPGVRRHQIGDGEFRLLLPLDQGNDSPNLRAVARLLHVRTRRMLSDRQKAALVQGRHTFQGKRGAAMLRDGAAS